MTTRLTFPASMFSVVCQRCGSTMRKSADSCPNCGADRSAAFGHKRGAGDARPRTSMFEQQASTPFASASASASGPIDTGDDEAPNSAWTGRWDPKRASERIAQRAAEHRAKRAEESARNAYADPSNDPDGLPGSGSRDRRKTIIAGACALALAAGAIVVLRQASDEQPVPQTESSASGAIDPKFGAFGRGATDAPAESALPGTPKPQAPTAQDSARVIAPDDPLYATRMALDRRDLTQARARIKALPAQQQTRPEFDALKDELANRELQRDAALQLARACERTSAWACVQQNAAEALALDGSNAESQAMLERVITHAGWLAATPQGAKAGAANAVDNTPNPAAATGAVAVAPAPAPVPSQAPANVATAAPSAPSSSPATAAPPAAVAAAKPAPERHTTPRAANATAAAAAARQAALDEARAETGYLSRAEKIARAQAATNAVVAATILPPTPAFASAPAVTATAPAKPATTSATTSATTTVESTKPAQAAQGNGLYVAPSAQNGMYVAPSAPTDMYVAPAAPNGMYVAPTPRPTPSPAPVQHTTPAGGQSSAAPAAAQALAQPAVSHAPPLLATSNTAPAVRPVATVQTAVATATLAPTTPVAGPGARAASTSAASTVTARFDADKSDDVERAIKQYGWSNTDAAPKPAR
ncbi:MULTISPECIES: zinc ribbon domain-containing protein [unclassified Caballeronia]|uniref:zinc ribbon domain-containing protein n=1 Tax=unclassified Caballeronia TaxID=2646786 RepID=UPI00285E12CB|nr:MULTISPECIES: zinc ribbon domain-containing protein [unclassified Caballeronia]MDR5739304.1 zinc ribbon domain-containing protein [Caballeronia sp. LZ016]MDR5807793.1 zinc ribbon domain-containing protein [Caballeronia sp. LZ019]